jgi:16S rRNA (uracil1498-N3)-methyltransferase
MLRLYVPAPPDAERLLRIAGDELRHLRTLRLAPGDRFRVFDGTGAEHEVVLDTIGTRAATARVVATRTDVRDSPLELVLVAALVKRDKMDWVVEKATELGVARIVPVTTRYAVARGDHGPRWRRIALAAAKQCGRTRIPVVDAIRPLADVLASAPPGLRLLAWEDEDARRLGDLPAVTAAATLVVGPEGGFHPDEVTAARAGGFVTVTLGRRVLRAETAAIVAVALCQHRWGDV